MSKQQRDRHRPRPAQRSPLLPPRAQLLPVRPRQAPAQVQCRPEATATDSDSDSETARLPFSPTPRRANRRGSNSGERLNALLSTRRSFDVRVHVAAGTTSSPVAEHAGTFHDRSTLGRGAGPSAAPGPEPRGVCHSVDAYHEGVSQRPRSVPIRTRMPPTAPRVHDTGQTAISTTTPGTAELVRAPPPHGSFACSKTDTQFSTSRWRRRAYEQFGTIERSELTGEGVLMESLRPIHGSCPTRTASGGGVGQDADLTAHRGRRRCLRSDVHPLNEATGVRASLAT